MEISLHTQADPPKTILPVTKNVPIAAIAKTKLLTGAKEQTALYQKCFFLVFLERGLVGE
jgi:hypothetical protein